MILLDTSVWIQAFRGKLVIPQQEVGILATCLPVYQEVLQGVRSDLHKKTVEKSMNHLVMLEEPLPRTTVQKAIDIYRTARKSGVTIRSSTDCLIAAIAISSNATLWTLDRDFTKIAKFTELKLRN